MYYAPIIIAALSVSVALADEEKVVIPFSFESKFDEGEYGKKVGELIWKKLEREGGFIIPESMLDVQDVCQRLSFHPNPETEMSEMGQVIRKNFGAQIGIWGSVERVPPHKTDVYDLRIIAVDFSDTKPKVIYDKKHRTKTVSEIPHLYVKNMLAVLYNKSPEAEAAPDPLVEKRWKEAPNLISNGTFEQGRGSPEGWDPLPQYVSLVKESRNRHLKMSFPKDVASTSGVLYYSTYFEVDQGATYRFSCRYRTSGSAVKVFIKCYDEFTVKTEQGESPHRREVYRSQQNLKGASGDWQTHTEDFTPKHSKYTPRFGRVMLYAYWPEGTVEWDDVVVKQIKPAPEE